MYFYYSKLSFYPSAAANATNLTCVYHAKVRKVGHIKKLHVFTMVNFLYYSKKYSSVTSTMRFLNFLLHASKTDRIFSIKDLFFLSFWREGGNRVSMTFASKSGVSSLMCFCLSYMKLVYEEITEV